MSVSWVRRQAILTIAHDAVEHREKLQRILKDEKDYLLEMEAETDQIERNSQDPNIKEHHLELLASRSYIRALEERLSHLNDKGGL